MRCDNCNLESEQDARFCRKCGIAISPSVKGSAEGPTSGSKVEEEAPASNKTSAMGPDFFSKEPQSQVVPLTPEDDRSSAKRLSPRGRLRAASLVVLIVLLQIPVAVATYMVMQPDKPRAGTDHQQSQQPATQPEQLQSPDADGQSQGTATTPGESTVSEPTREVTSLAGSDEAINEREKVLDDRERGLGDRERKLDDRERRIKERQKKVAADEEKLKLLRNQVTAAENRLRKVKAEIAAGRQRVKKLRIEETALTRRLRGLNTEVAQISGRVKKLKSEIAGFKNTDDRRRSRQKTRRA